MPPIQMKRPDRDFIGRIIEYAAEKTVVSYKAIFKIASEYGISRPRARRIVEVDLRELLVKLPCGFFMLRSELEHGSIDREKILYAVAVEAKNNSISKCVDKDGELLKPYEVAAAIRKSKYI